MKKLLLLTGLMSTAAAVEASAQNYYPGYAAPAPDYSYQAPAAPSSDYAYQAPQPAVANYAYNAYTPAAPAVRKPADDFKHFSIGLDYVIGKTSMVDRKFEIDNPLYGGNVYQGKTDDFEDSLDSLNGNIGWRPYKYFGIEAFYQHSLSDNEVKYQEHYAQDNRFAQAEYSVKYNAYGLDLIGYWPVMSRLEFLASVGAANYDFKAEAKLNAYNNSTANLVSSHPLKMDDSKLAFRYGIGAQIWLSNRLTFRMMYRYVDIGGDYFDDISEIALGVRYNF